MGNVTVPLVMLAGAGALVYVGVADPVGGGFAGIGNLIRGLPNTKASPAGFGAATAADLAAVGGGSPIGGPPIPGATGRRATVLAAATSWLGVPYEFGGNTRHGIDCSGLTLQCYAAAGVHLPRVAALQALRGKRVRAGQAQPGDLVCFGNPAEHVGIYLGGGQMIDAPHDNTVVRREAVDYGAHPITYRNILGGTAGTGTVSRKR